MPATTAPPGVSTEALIIGHNYTITATGTATCDTAVGGGATCQSSPDGASTPGFGGCGNNTETPAHTCQVSGALFGRLVGRISNVPDNNLGTGSGTANDYFSIGSSLTFTAATGGTLYLSFNDYTGPRTNGPNGNTDYFQDNSGSYSVTVTDNTTPPPPPTPEAPSMLLFAAGAGAVLLATQRGRFAFRR